MIATRKGSKARARCWRGAVLLAAVWHVSPSPDTNVSGKLQGEVQMKPAADSEVRILILKKEDMKEVWCSGCCLHLTICQTCLISAIAEIVFLISMATRKK